MSPDWDALRGSVAGEILRPGSAGYEEAYRPAIALFHDVRPQAVARCATPEDVAEVIAFAVRTGLRAAPRSGGHCFAGRSSTRGILVDVGPMRSVSVSGEVVTIGAGARLGPVYDALDERALTVPAGCGPDVGITGLTLGGGLGVLGRTYGLTSDHLLGARVVLADGRTVACDADHEPELYWALRGAGGGHFGVVTSLDLATIPAPEATAFHLRWAASHASAVIDAWQHAAPDAPDALSASLLVTVDGDRPPAVTLSGAMLGDRDAAVRALEDLVARAGADPESADHRHLPYRDVKRHLAESGPAVEDRHAFAKSEFFAGTVPTETITRLVAHLMADRVEGQTRELDFTPWGGAYNRVRGDATAFAHRDERFLLKHTVTVAPDASPFERQAALDWLSGSWSMLRPWGTGRVYPNFPDPDLREWARAYHGANYDRLVEAKRRYDPGTAFRFHQSIPACP